MKNKINNKKTPPKHISCCSPSVKWLKDPKTIIIFSLFTKSWNQIVFEILSTKKGWRSKFTIVCVTFNFNWYLFVLKTAQNLLIDTRRGVGIALSNRKDNYMKIEKIVQFLQNYEQARACRRGPIYRVRYCVDTFDFSKYQRYRFSTQSASVEIYFLSWKYRIPCSFMIMCL